MYKSIKKYQRTEYYFSSNAAAYVFSNTDAGDPVFLGQPGDNYIHSVFCAEVDGSENLYNSHSSDYYQVDITTWNTLTHAHYFHIKGPDHCTNCELDGDETAIDCGGSCPPCEVAPDNKNYDYNTSSLPAVTRAINYIMAGNAQVQVLSGQNVHFISLGHIILKPGFHAQSGSMFRAERKHMREQATADCPKFCDPVQYNAFVHPDPVEWEIAGGRYFEIYVWQSCNGIMNNIYYGNGIINQEGLVELWDGYSGVVNDPFNCTVDQFTIYVHITSCQGNVYSYAEVIAYFDPQPIINDSSTIDNNVNIYQENIDNQINKFQKDVILYPNPTKDVIHLSFIEQNSDVHLSIYDIVGKELFKQIITDDEYDVDLSPYHAGVYLFRITSKEYKHTFKIIKQ